MKAILPFVKPHNRANYGHNALHFFNGSASVRSDFLRRTQSESAVAGVVGVREGSVKTT